MNRKREQSIYHANVNLDLMRKNVIQINGRIMINVYVSLRKVMYVCLEMCVWNPDTCNCENGKYLASVMNDSAIVCDEIIDADAEAKLNDEANSNDEETKTNFNEKKATIKDKIPIFHFINYYNIIDSFFYLLLFDKISSKKKNNKTLPFNDINNKLKEVVY